MKRKDRSDRILEAVLFGIGIACFALIMILIAGHNIRQQHEELMDRADYLIARSEASIERWNHGNSLR